jgi:hypothetical protein
MGSLVQRQPQQEVVSRSRAPLFAALLVAAAALAGCEREASERRPARSTPAHERVAALAGRAGDLAAFLVPLHFEADPTRFANERLDRVAAAGRPLAFFDLFLLDVREAGAGAAPVRIESPSVTLVSDAGRVRSTSLAGAVARAEARSSVLPMLALETFAGSELRPGASIKALVAFDAPLALERVAGGEVQIGALVVPLRKAALDEPEFERLNGRPTREQVFAAAGGDEGASDQGDRR